ncbi:hypothetical protein DSM106972_075210 [Dulcicalothrix desertica PCC 7102]|uniref:Uncharacterized protein n=1 Tax=Dulcicalothrix desertica PCC 7102 TaxID=232991 RepID=A0A433V2S2_9CYAN|nr:hypothetical protein [Dulcicalothrix desertica]RUT00393.1 hypothetical protein DSM106972_075210 [Dulcicalothrix desertica PCC 7102]TWH42500.1 hypothetical protein CAL7102_06162 [Dulcicalothrix desertica PCC 7102]
MVTSTTESTILNDRVQKLVLQDFQPLFDKCQDVKEPSEWCRKRRSMGEILHVLTLISLNELNAKNWLEIENFQQTNYSKIKNYIPNYGLPVRAGTFWNKLNIHLKMEVFVPSFINWTEQIAEASNHQIEPLTEAEAAIVRTLTTRQSWRVLGLLRFWANKNPEFKASCRGYFKFTA